ncbi:hypothetical protein DOY81_014430 [Sarcophaga bullata]|nr:hypothetical protein DOY81_014430 [Sarcophaga bullata]
MIYESSYETGRIPFVPILNRGHWAKTSDFIYASLALSYRMDISLIIMLFTSELSITSLLPGLVISLVLYVMPLLMVQSFMGQFSSSGFISAFRISPLFKGLGYVSLVLNILMLIFASVFATIPLVYLGGSLNPALPWSCDGVYSDLSFCKEKSERNEFLDYLGEHVL